MSTIYDRAVRALQPVLNERGDDGHALAYWCGTGCGHITCAAVHAIDDADLLAYVESAIKAAVKPADGDHAATALDQLKLADDLAETRADLHANALAAAQVHAQLHLATSVLKAGLDPWAFAAQPRV